MRFRSLAKVSEVRFSFFYYPCCYNGKVDMLFLSYISSYFCSFSLHLLLRDAILQV